MGSVYVVVRPPTKRATIETIRFIEQIEFNAIFISLPRIFECYISDYLKHKNFDVFMRQISENMQSEIFLTSSIRGYEDLLKALCYIARDRPIHCYGSVLKNKFETELAYSCAQLTLHDIITGKISLERWLSILSSLTINFSKWIKEEAEYLAAEESKYSKIICIAGYDGSELKRGLSNYCETWIKYTGQPFHLPPIQTLVRMMSIRSLSQPEIIKLIEEHVRFIKDFIIPHGLEDGLELWSRKKLYWLTHLN